MYRKVTLLLIVALAVTLAAATVSIAAPKEKRVVCQNGVTKEIPAHAKAKGATQGPCPETPPQGGGGDLRGWTAVPQEEPEGINIAAVYIFDQSGGLWETVEPCVIYEAHAELTLERDGVQYILNRENNPDMTWYATSIVVGAVTYSGRLQFEQSNGKLTELPGDGGNFTIVYSTGIACPE